MAAPPGPKIVLIEDNPSISHYLEVVLSSVGYRVIVALTAQDGWDATQRERPAVVLLDLHLPDMHGGRVLNAIRKDKTVGHTPVIVLTGSEKISDVSNAVSRGASDYVTKPVDSMSLLEKIGRYAPLRVARAG